MFAPISSSKSDPPPQPSPSREKGVERLCLVGYYNSFAIIGSKDDKGFTTMANEFARHLRKTMTEAEQKLWWNLRCEQLKHKFRRQVPIGPYIVDFLCLERRLIIELDGSQHAVQVEEDATRTVWLNSQGFRVLRFWNFMVFEDMDTVLEAIGLALEGPIPKQPRRDSTSSRRRRGLTNSTD